MAKESEIAPPEMPTSPPSVAGPPAAVPSAATLLTLPDALEPEMRPPLSPTSPPATKFAPSPISPRIFMVERAVVIAVPAVDPAMPPAAVEPEPRASTLPVLVTRVRVPPVLVPTMPPMVARYPPPGSDTTKPLSRIVPSKRESVMLPRVIVPTNPPTLLGS